MTLSLPEPIETYFEVSNGAEIAGLACCFTEDATVTDENRSHRGPQAIQSWQQEARRKFSYSVQPLHVERDHRRVTVSASIAGNFPGSPLQLDHVFQLAGDKISSLEIR